MTTMTLRKPKGGLETITLGQLMAHEFPEREDLVFPWLRQGESAMIWAAPGTGKTLLTLTLALMVAGGGEVASLGWSSPKPRKVLLVDGEMAAEDLKERVGWLAGTIVGIDKKAAEANLSILSRNWQAAEVPFPDLGDRDGKPSGQDIVFREVSRRGAELVLLDNFSTLAEVADENEASAMTPTLAFLLRLKQARIGCVLVHHSGKEGNTYRGSSKLATTFEVILGLRPLEGTAGIGGAAFKIEWTKYRRKQTEATMSREVHLRDDADGKPQWVAEATMEDDMRRLRDVLETCRHGTQRELAAALGWDPSKVTRLKVKAAKEGIIDDRQWSRCLRAALDEREGAERGAESDF